VTADFRTSAQGSQALRTGSKIWVSGEQGVGGYDQGYARDRRVATDISPEEIEALLRAYEDGGDRGLRDWMKEFFEDERAGLISAHHDGGRKTRMSKSSNAKANAGPRWSRKRLIGMLDCHGPTARQCRRRRDRRTPASHRPRFAADLRATSQSRPVAIPKHRIVQPSAGRPRSSDATNSGTSTRSTRLHRSTMTPRSCRPGSNRVADQHTGPLWPSTQTVAAIAVTNASSRALAELRRRGATVAKLTLPTRFHAQVLAHAVMTRQQAWRVHPIPRRLAAGHTQVWMADAPPVDLAALTSDLGFESPTTGLVKLSRWH
jgi:hypothetical protein